jgi:serine/threonine protein kinase
MDMSAVTCPACKDAFVESADGECVSCLLRAAESADPRFLIQEKLRYFGDFELKEALGHGGMGMVFRAWQVSMRREVALKMINSGELASTEAVRRFRREAEAALLLDHPNIVKVYAVGEHEGHHYIAMELAAGRDLATKIPSLKDDSRAACRIVAQVARAVHFAHQHGVLHRDLKPANILVDENNVALLTDFGLAKITAGRRISGHAISAPGRLLGTPAYMAPEQFDESAQHVTIGSEVYSLGVILYETLTGRLPYAPENSVDLLNHIRAHEVIPLRAVDRTLPRGLQNICAKALRKDQRSRYRSAEEFAADLERWLEGEPVHAQAESAAELILHWAERNRAAVAVGAILVAALVSSSVLLIGLQKRSKRIEHLIEAARSQQQADLEKLWTDGNLTHQKITSETLSILANVEDSGSQGAVHYSIGAYENNGQLTNTVQSYAPVFKHLEKSMARSGGPPRFDLLLYKFNPVARAGFAERQFNIGRFGAHPCFLLRQNNPDIVVIATENSERTGVIFVRSDSPVRSVTQLKRASLAMGEESSTTSGIYARAFLYDHGLRQADFKTIKWHPVNGGAVLAVSDGEFEAGVSGHNTFLKSGRTNLTIIAMFESQPAVWVARKSLGEPFLSALREAFLSCPPEIARRLIGANEDAKPFDLPAAAQFEIARAAAAKRDAFVGGAEKPAE